MNASTTPESGDVAARPEQADPATPGAPQQTLQEVLEGAEPTEEFLEEMRSAQDLPELSEEDLARQALTHPGEDGDAATPE